MSIFSSKFLEEYNKVKLDDLKRWVINNHYLNHDRKSFSNEDKILSKCLNLSELRHNILFFGGTQNLNDFHRDFMNCLMEGFEYNNKNKEEKIVKKKTVKIKGEIE